ncbi:MAG: hypothetical protein M0R32_12410, partial [Candidatus Cloacimonetes bacterium]|nr:hypothetical protein [Candidatus Cloacimonadota bacterium]
LGNGSDKTADMVAGWGRKLTGEEDPAILKEAQRKQMAELNANYEVQMANNAKWAQEQGFKDFPQAAHMAEEGLIDLQPDPKNQDKWLMKYLSDKAQDEVTMRIGNDEAKASVQSKYSRQIQEQLAASQKRGALFSLIDSKGMEEKKSKLPLSLQSSLEQSMINQALVERAQTKQGKTTWSSPEAYDKMLEPYLRTAPESAKAHWEKYKDADVKSMDMNNPLRNLRQVDKKEASQARLYAQNFGNDPSRYTRDFMNSPEGKKIGEQYGGNTGLWLVDEAAKINDSRGSKFGTGIRQSLLAVDPKYEEKVAKMTASKSLRGFTPEGVNYSVDREQNGVAQQMVAKIQAKKEKDRSAQEKALLEYWIKDSVDMLETRSKNESAFRKQKAMKSVIDYQVGMTKKIMGDESYASAVENSRKEHPETWEKYGEKAEAIFARKQQMAIAEHARRMNPLDRTPEQSLAMGHLVGKYANGNGLPVKPRGFGRPETDNLYGGPQKDRTGPLMFSDIVDDANKGIYTEQAKDAIGPGAMGQLGLKEMSPEASFWQDRAAARIKESERLSAQAHAAYSYSSDGSKTYNPSPRNAVYDYYHSNGRDSKGPMKSGSTEYTSMSNEAGAAYMPGARVVLPGSNQLTPAEWQNKGVMVAPGASAKPMDAAAWELKYGAARGGYVGYAKGGKFGSRLNTSNFGSGDGGAGFRSRMNTSEFRSGAPSSFGNRGDGGAGFRSRMTPSEFRSGAPSSFGNRGDGGAGFRSRMTPSSFARGGFVGGTRRMSSQLNETARTNTANKVSSTAPQKNGSGGGMGAASPQLFKLEMDSDFKGLAVISNKSMNYGNPNQV